MRNLFRKCVSVVSGKRLFLVILNWLFFGVMLVAPFLAQSEYARLYERPMGVFSVERDNLPLMFLNIFFSNIILSGFVVLTLSGFVFFVLPVGFIFWRAWLWGVLLNELLTWQFLAAFPTLILEGEGYVLAALAGVNLGLSWLKPEWAYKEEGLSRVEAVKRALKDCVYIYVLVAIFLFVASVVEIATIFLAASS